MYYVNKKRNEKDNCICNKKINKQDNDEIRKSIRFNSSIESLESKLRKKSCTQWYDRVSNEESMTKGFIKTKHCQENKKKSDNGDMRITGVAEMNKQNNKIPGVKDNKTPGADDSVCGNEHKQNRMNTKELFKETKILSTLANRQNTIVNLKRNLENDLIKQHGLICKCRKTKSAKVEIPYRPNNNRMKQKGDKGQETKKFTVRRHNNNRRLYYNMTGST